jgi:hypothetical protein
MNPINLLSIENEEARKIGTNQLSKIQNHIKICY